MTFKDIKASWPYSERLEKRISCEKCGALFDTKKARREHIIAAHPFAATHFSCSLCQKSFRGLKGRVSVQGVESLWGDCRFNPADWGS